MRWPHYDDVTGLCADLWDWVRGLVNRLSSRGLLESVELGLADHAIAPHDPQIVRGHVGEHVGQRTWSNSWTHEQTSIGMTAG